MKMGAGKGLVIMECCALSEYRISRTAPLACMKSYIIPSRTL
jgi:hypothetical protein